MNAEDRHSNSTQPLPTSGGDLDDTLPSTPVPGDLRALHEEVIREEPPTEVPLIEGTQQPEPYRTPPPTLYGAEVPNEDEIVTPAPFAPPSEAREEPPRRTRPSRGLQIAVVLCLILSIASLALNGLLIYSLLSVRNTALEGLDAAITAVDTFGGKGFQYEYKFEQTIPVAAEIPIQQDMVFPFEGDFPINTTVEVPIDAGVLGSFVVEVPINTSIYVNTEVPIHVDQMFEISTTLPISMTIPIDVQPDDPAIQNLLENVREWLMELRASFMGPSR